ncbi:hypothetical protein Csa_023719, partial [Cucumis sativus]
LSVEVGPFTSESPSSSLSQRSLPANTEWHELRLTAIERRRQTRFSSRDKMLP